MLCVPVKASNFNEVSATAHGSNEDICGTECPMGAYLQLWMKWQNCQDSQVSATAPGFLPHRKCPPASGQLELRFQPESYLETWVHNLRAFLWALTGGKTQSIMVLYECSC